jgi:hypothetical protein
VTSGAQIPWFLHRYIQTKNGVSGHRIIGYVLIDMLSRLRKNLSRRGESLDLQTPHNRSREKATQPTKQGTKKIWPLSGQPVQAQHKKGNEKSKKDTGNGVNTIKSLGTTSNNVTPRSHGWPR